MNNLNEDDTFSADPIIVFDENNNQEIPIPMGFRQPSFTSLQGIPIPKGFKSIDDLKSEKPPRKVEKFIDEEGLPTDSLNEFLTRRNAKKWLDMGYEPQDMEKFFHRNTSHSHFLPSKQINTQNKTVFSSFSTLDSINPFMKQDKIKDIDLIIEEENIILENNNNNSKKIKRRLSSGGPLASLGELISFDIDESNLEEKNLTKNISIQNNNLNDIENLKVSNEFLTFINENLNSNIYLILNGEKLENLNKKDIIELRTKLNYYINFSLENNFFNDAIIIQNILKEFKSNQIETTPNTNRSTKITIEKINELKKELENLELLWDEKIEQIKNEELNSLEDLEKRFSIVLLEHDKSWQLPSKQIYYNKPSSNLLNLRHTLSKVIKAKQLDKIEQISNQIENLEKLEIIEAQRRMENDYQISLNKLKEIYKSEKISIINNNQTKINHLLRSKEIELRPLISRIDNLEKINDNYNLKNSKFKDINIINNNQIKNFKLPLFVSSAKLTLPQFNPNKKNILNKTQPINKKNKKLINKK